MSRPTGHRIIDVADIDSFALLPPCADPRFDHRSCDYWEDEHRGSKAARSSWWRPSAPPPPPRPTHPDNPFAPSPDASPAFNPFAPEASPRSSALSDAFGDIEPGDPFGAPAFNPFAARPGTEPRQGADAPRKLRLLGRGLGVLGSYAKVLLVDGERAAYAQFGPLSAYPRAQRLRDLYPSLPQTPLPAVVTCVATTQAARGQGLGRILVEEVLADLARRGFAAVEAYPDLTLSPDEASAADPDFWQACGFRVAVDDERFPVMRRSL